MKQILYVLAGMLTTMTISGCVQDVPYRANLTVGESPMTIRAIARVEPFVDESPEGDKSRPFPGIFVNVSSGAATDPDNMTGDVSTVVTDAFLQSCNTDRLFEICRKNISSPDIIVRGRILRFYGAVGPTFWGHIPWVGALLAMFSGPVKSDEAEVQLEISLHRPDGALLDKYEASEGFSKWYSWYGQTQVAERLNMTFSAVVKKIRGRMVANAVKYARVGPPKGGMGQEVAVKAIPPDAVEVDQLPQKQAKPNPNAFAIVVGIEQYRQDLPASEFSSHDAEIMDKYLTGVLGYPEKNVVMLLNERATKTDLEKYIEGWLTDRVRPGDNVFIYFSGHGAPNPQTGDAYLVPYDGDPAYLEKTGYQLKRLYDTLGKLPAKEVVVLLDSCFSGAGGRSVVAKGMRPMGLSLENPLAVTGNTVVLAASAGNQVSSTYMSKGHGLLTYFFLKGLKGEGDQNKDGGIDLSELFAYIKPQVETVARREFHNEQTTQLVGNQELLARGVRLIDRPNPQR